MIPEITNKAWTFDAAGDIYETKTSLLKTVGPFDPWGQRFYLMGVRDSKDGLTGETTAWYPTTIIDNTTVALMVFNDGAGDPLTN